MCPNEAVSEEMEVETYIKDLHPEDKDEVKAYLAEMLSHQLGINCGLQQENLPKALVTRLYLERVIPDEETARAYLQALLKKDTEIRAIEGEKRRIATSLVDPYSKQGESHRRLLGHIWDSKDRLVSGGSVGFEVLRIECGENSEIFDNWAEAELTRVKMQSFIKNLAPVESLIKNTIIDGTKIQQRHGDTRIPIRDWIIAASLVAQADISPKPLTLKPIITERSTAKRVLTTMRLAMMESIENEIAKNVVLAHGYQYMDDVVKGFRLYFKKLGKDDKVKHRNDIVSKGIGNMMVVEIDKDDIQFVGYAPSKVSPGETQFDLIQKKFEGWCKSHQNKIKEEHKYQYLYEFAYRYNADKKRLLGWSLINEMLRTLLDSRWVMKTSKKKTPILIPSDTVKTKKPDFNLWDEISLKLEFDFND